MTSLGALATAHGTLSTRLYRSSRGSVGLALWLGQLDVRSAVLGRLHSSCFTSEGLGGLDCDCVSQLEAAFRAIAQAGRGVVFYLLQEGRGAGLQAKIRDRELVQTADGDIDTFAAYEQLGLPPDPRSYSMVPAICADLRVPPSFRLMTNNPAKLAAFAAAGIAVERVELGLPASEFNSDYLAAKARSGHVIRVSGAACARAPRELEALDPRLETVGRFRRVGSYSLPVRVRRQSVWFRATAYSVPGSSHDRVVLTHRASNSTRHELRHIYRENLYERFRAGEASGRYRAALDRIVAHGAGSVLAIPGDAELFAEDHAPTRAEDRALLDAHGAAVGATSSEVVA